MSREEREFLGLARYPALLTLLQCCWILGFSLHQGEILVRQGHLVPVGKRSHRKSRLFATAYILELADDRDWLAKAVLGLRTHWVRLNGRRSKLGQGGAQTFRQTTEFEKAVATSEHI